MKSNKLNEYFGLIVKNSELRKLWLGLTISYVGDTFYEIAIAWYIYSVTGSSLMVGLLLVAIFLPNVVFGLFLGVLVDRYARKKLMVISLVIQTIATALLVVAFVFNLFPLIALYTVTILLAIASAIFVPAQYSTIPDIVQKEDIISANSFFSSSQRIAQILGVVLGGTVIALLGVTFAIGINSITFLIALMFIMLLKNTFSPKKQRSQDEESINTMWSDIKEGFSWLKSNKILFNILMIATVSNIALGPINILPPMLIKTEFGLGPTSLGIFEAALGLGVLLGGISIGILKPNRVGLLFGLGLGLQGFGMLVVSFAPGLILAFTGNFIFGIGLAGTILPVSTAFQTLVPSYLRGRISSINNLLTGIVIPLTYAFIGLLGDIIGPQYCYLFGALLLGGCMLCGLFSSKVRTYSMNEEIIKQKGISF